MRVDRTRGKGKLLLENGDRESSIEGEVDEEAKKARHKFLDKMDAIACGVEARFEENTGYSRRVAEMTVEIARALGVPECDITRWASSRLMHDMEKAKVIKSLLERLQRSSVQQGLNWNISRKKFEVNLL